MAVETQSQIQAQPLERLKRYRFTVTQYERLAAVGILTEDSRVELLEGEIIVMPPIDSSHSGRINVLMACFTPFLGNSAILTVQNPVRLNDFSEPQPDLMLLRFREDYYVKSHPTPDDVLILIEISNTTLAYDRGVKLHYYALAGIPEVWVIDLNAELIEQYTRPENGAYGEIKKIGRGASISATLMPSVTLKADQILGY